MGIGLQCGGAAHKHEAGKRDKPKSRLSRGEDTREGKRSSPSDLPIRRVQERPDRLSDEVVIVKHRIVRQTTGKIYVNREPFQEEKWQSKEEGTPEAFKTRAVAINREVLRREGRFPHRGSYFYASEEKGIQGINADLTARHAWCAALDVCFPCSVESIKAAYRRLAREKHPDVGGNQSEFRAVERHYREALAYFSSRDEASKPI